MFHGIPEPPGHLIDEVKEIWRAYAPVYGVTVADMPLFEAFCESYRRWRDCVHLANQNNSPLPKRADEDLKNFRMSLSQMLRMRQSGTHDAASENNEPPLSIEEERARLLAVIEAEIEGGQDTGGNRRDSARAKPRAKVVKKSKADDGGSGVRAKKDTRRRTRKTEEPQES